VPKHLTHVGPTKPLAAMQNVDLGRSTHSTCQSQSKPLQQQMKDAEQVQQSTYRMSAQRCCALIVCSKHGTQAHETEASPACQSQECKPQCHAVRKDAGLRKARSACRSSYLLRC